MQLGYWIAHSIESIRLANQLDQWNLAKNTSSEEITIVIAAKSEKDMHSVGNSILIIF